MNLLRSVSRVLIVAAVLCVGKANAGDDFKQTRYFKYVTPYLCVAGATAICDKKNPVPIFTKKLVDNKRKVIIVKAILGAYGHMLDRLEYNELFWNDRLEKQNGDDEKEIAAARAKDQNRCFGEAAGYVVVNGALRFGGDYLMPDEDFIDKKCDELLSENAAWVIKPVAKVCVDLAYHYGTIAIVQSIGGEGIKGNFKN